MASGTPDPRPHAAFGMDGPERAPGRKRNLPPDLSEEQCRELGRQDGQADRDARIVASRTPGDYALVREPDGGTKLQVNMWPTEPGLRCGQAYGDGYTRGWASS
jgi:hypothetical protein